MTDKITSVVAREQNGNIQLNFTIPFKLIKSAQDEALKEYAKNTEVPGFRKGNAPLNKVAEKVPQSQITEHALTHLLPSALADTVSENKLNLAIYPKFELVSAKEGDAWQIRGVTCELPEVKLGDYKKVISGINRAKDLWTPEKGKPNEKGRVTNEEKEQTVIKALLDNVKIDIPQILIEEEATSRLSSLLARLEKLGLALEGYLSSIGKSAEDIRADYAKQARDVISLDLVLSKIAESENIKIEEKEIEQALNMSQTVKSESGEDNERQKRLIESILKRRAALDFLINLS